MYKVQEHQVGAIWKDATIDYAGHQGWGGCTFHDKREAEIYAYLWCNSVTAEQAAERAPTLVIGVGQEYCTELTYGHPVTMRLIEV